MVVEKFVPSPESLFCVGFEGRGTWDVRNFAGMSLTHGGLEKVCAKKVCAHFRPLRRVSFDFQGHGISDHTKPSTPNSNRYF